MKCNKNTGGGGDNARYRSFGTLGETVRNSKIRSVGFFLALITNISSRKHPEVVNMQICYERRTYKYPLRERICLRIFDPHAEFIRLLF